MNDDAKQELGEVSAAIRTALYRACPHMPSYPIGIVDPHLAALRQHAHDQGYYKGYTYQLSQTDALKAEIERLREIVYRYVDPFDVVPEDEDFVQAAQRAALEQSE